MLWVIIIILAFKSIPYIELSRHNEIDRQWIRHRVQNLSITVKLLNREQIANSFGVLKLAKEGLFSDLMKTVDNGSNIS